MTRLLAALIISMILPATGMAALARSFALGPDTLFASNEVIDIIEHNGAIWMATSLGVNFTNNQGDTWQLYDAASGLPTDDISSLFSLNGLIWVSTNHQELIGGDPVNFSDGMTYSNDDGSTWQRADFLGQVQYFPGGERTVFDITGHYDGNNQNDSLGFNDDWIFFSAFAAGLIGSRDGGQNWRRVFASFNDSVNFTQAYQGLLPDLPLLNRHFSSAIDTSHGDTIFLWAGTAGGTIQYIFPDPRDKPFVQRISRVAFCDQCADPDSAFVFIGGELGLMRGLPNGRGFMTRFVEDGLPGSYVSALIDFHGRLFVGTLDSSGGIHTGLAYSDDRGESFYPGDPTLDSKVTADSGALLDFTTIGQRLYMAGAVAGLFVSDDTGASWTRIWIDSTDTTPGNLINSANALDSLGNDLLVGTDSGLVTLYLDNQGLIDSQRVSTFFDITAGLEKVTRVRSQLFYDSTDAIIDSVAIWTINPSIWPDTNRYVHRALDTGGVLVWDDLRYTELVNDIIINSDVTFLVGETGVDFIASYTGPNSSSFAYEVADSTSTDRFAIADTVTTMAFNGDQVVVGGVSGFALSPNLGVKHRIFRVNQDTLSPDVSINYTYQTSGLGGNFVQSLGVQYLDSLDLSGGQRRIDSGLARIWVSGSPTGVTDPATQEKDDVTGLSVGIMFPVDINGAIRQDNVPTDSIDHYQRIWALAHQSVFAWNFAFYGETVFAATDWGLIYFNGDIINDTILVWDTLEFRDSSGVSYTLPGTPVYAVEVVDDDLWVGTQDGVARVDLTDVFLTTTDFFTVIDSTSPADEVYAFPVPFRHSDETNRIKFRYTVQKPAYVTIEVYDFAMNLVNRPLDHVFHQAGVYQSSNAQNASWDGMNDKGQEVAVGIYYFKVSYSTGEQRWGKIAVLP